MKKGPRSPRNWLILPLSFFLRHRLECRSIKTTSIFSACSDEKNMPKNEMGDTSREREKDRGFQRAGETGLKRRLGTSAFSWSNCVFQVLEKAHVLDATYFWLLWDGSTWRVYQFVGSSCLSVIIDASFLFLFFSSLFFFLPPSSTFPLCVQVFRGAFVQRIAFKESIFEKLIWN